MTDLIQNVQDVFKKWESRGTANFNSRGRRGQAQRSNPGRSGIYSDTFSSFNSSGERRFKQRPRVPYFKLPKYDGLAHFKMAPCVMTENKQRPFMGSCCSKCLPLSRASVSDSRVFSLSICNILHIPHFQSLNFRVVLNRLKKKQKSSYPDVSGNIMKSESVVTAVEDAVVLSSVDYEGCNESWRTKVKTEHYSRVKHFLDSIKSSVSSICLHFCSFLLHSVLSRTFDGILVHKGQLEIIKNLGQENTPVIYLPLHQSYLDSVLISFIVFMNSMTVPLIPIEEDTCIPFLRYFLKFIGVYFVRNHLDGYDSDVDHVLYSTVLQNYIAECVKAGCSLELLVDKDFTLSNQFQLDKHHLLSTVIDSILKGSIEDAHICVISASYEKLPCGNIVKEQLGQSHNKISLLASLYSLWKFMHLKYGIVRLNFGQPFSIKEFLQTSKRNFPSESPDTSSLTNEKSSFEKQDHVKSFLELTQRNLKKHIVYDAVYSTPLMSTHLVAFLLLTQYRKGVTQQQLQNSMDWLRGQLSNRKRDTGFSGQSLPVIKRAVELLGKNLITIEVVDMEWTSSDLENNNVKVTIYHPVIKLPHVLELQYYASHVVPVFILDSIVVNALYALVDVEICHFRHCDSQLYVSRDKLIDKSIELSDLLQFEFTTMPPCSDVALSFSDAVDVLIEKECLHAAGMNISCGRPSKYVRKPHSLCFDASDDEDNGTDALTVKEQQLKVDLSEESISHLEFLRSVLSPFVESYWLAAITLLKLIDEVKKENVFIQEMQQTAQEKLYKGLLGYEESFSAVTFQNSLKLFESWHVLDSYVQDGIKIVYLNESFNNKEQIDCIISKIEEFRK